MGQLPAPRVTPSPLFSKTGMDFAGLFLLKRGYTQKPVIINAYICIFICFSTKATHIELVSDLTSEAFLAALKRFIARRGRPDELFSDNGSNFKGAHNTLQDLYRFLASDTSQHPRSLLETTSWRIASVGLSLPSMLLTLVGCGRQQ